MPSAAFSYARLALHLTPQIAFAFCLDTTRVSQDGSSSRAALRERSAPFELPHRRVADPQPRAELQHRPAPQRQTPFMARAAAASAGRAPQTQSVAPPAGRTAELHAAPRDGSAARLPAGDAGGRAWRGGVPAAGRAARCIHTKQFLRSFPPSQLASRRAAVSRGDSAPRCRVPAPTERPALPGTAVSAPVRGCGRSPRLGFP